MKPSVVISHHTTCQTAKSDQTACEPWGRGVKWRVACSEGRSFCHVYLFLAEDAARTPPLWNVDPKNRGEESYTQTKIKLPLLSLRIAHLKTAASALLCTILRKWSLNNLVVKGQFHIYISCLLKYKEIKAHRKLRRNVASPGFRLDRGCTVIWTVSSLFNSVLGAKMALTAMTCQ